MLNDAFVLGGIYSKHDFHFALSENADPIKNEQKAWKDIHGPAVEKIRAAAWPWQRRRFGVGKRLKVRVSSEKAKGMWLAFFQQVHRVLWENGIPRTCVRMRRERDEEQPASQTRAVCGNQRCLITRSK